MRTHEEFEQFCRTDLSHHIEMMEPERKKTVGRLVGAFVLAAAAGGGLSYWSQHPAFVIVGIVLAGISYPFLTYKYRKSFKTSVIARIVRFLDSDLRYEPEKFITQQDFQDSGMFPTTPNIYRGDDLVTGALSGIPIAFSEIVARRQTGTGKNRRTHTVFQGLFLKAELQQSFQGKTVIVLDTAEKTWGRVAVWFQEKFGGRGDVVRFENTEFERHFCVYSTAEQEARAILDSEMIQRLLELKKGGRNIAVSVSQNKAYVAVAVHRSMWEAPVFRKPDAKILRTYLEDINLVFHLIEQLRLYSL